MTLNLATMIADDYTLFDGVQTVTLRDLVGGSATVAGVTSSPLNFNQMALVGGLVTESETLSFSLAKAACGSVVPVQGATIVDAAGISWRVLSVGVKTLDTRYSCACTRDKQADSAPFQPFDLADNGSETNALRLAWTNPSPAATGITGTVQYSTTADFTSPASLSVGTISGAAITFESTPFSSGTYYVRVRHANAKGNSPWSATIAVTLIGVELQRYIMASFPDNAEVLHMLTSSDGTTFVEYGATNYSVPSLRDPRLYYDTTIGKYRLAYTSLGFLYGGFAYGYAECPVPLSDPFVFTKVADIDTTPAGTAGSAWAPTWFFHRATATLHTTISLNIGSPKFQRYEQHPISADGTRWSDPALITGTAIPDNVIDCQVFLHPDDGLYYMIGKNETTKYSFLVSSTSPFSGYDTLVKSGDWLGTDSNLEGFGIFQNDIGGWRITFDKYVPDVGMSFVDSTTRDFATATWTTRTTMVAPFRARNSGIVFKNGTPLVAGEQQTVTWTALKNYVNGSGQNFTASNGTSTSSAFSFDNGSLLRTCNDLADALRLQIESFAAVGAGNVLVSGSMLSGDTASGLIRHYKFDETSGTSAADVSGNAQTATLVGGASFSTTNAPLVPGNVRSLLLDGVNGYVSLPNNFLVGCTTGFSLSVWVYLNASINWQYIFESVLSSKYMLMAPKGSPGGVPRGIVFTTNAGSGENITYTGVDCPTASWQHLVFTLDGTNAKIYQQGKLKVTNANTFVPSAIGNSTTNQFGKSHFGDPYFNGCIDEARFYDYALSASEVNNLAQGGDQLKNTITYAASLGNVPQITIGGSLGSPAIAATVATI